MSRTPRIAAVLLTAAIALTGCSASAPGDDQTGGAGDGTFPVTIEHAFGETEITAQAERVVTLGWGSTDAALALGVVPVAIPSEDYAGGEDGVLPWIEDALDELGAQTPTVLPASADEPAYEEIAEAAPDLILAPYSGVTEEQYELLSAIAPTVVYPETAWATPWRDVITIVGESLGMADEADAVLADIDDQLASVATEHPEFEGKTVAAVWDVAGTFYVYKPEDPRVEFMFDLGLQSAPSVEELANGDQTFFYTLSYEQLDQLEADILVAYANTQEEFDAFLAAGYAQAIPAVQSGAVAPVVGTELVSSVSPPTALSLPWGLDQLVDALTAAAPNAG